MASTRELLDRFVDLFNDNRIEEGEQDFAPGGYLEEVGTNRRLTPPESTASAREWKAAFPDARGTITNRIVEGNRGMAEIVWRGTNRGSLMGQPPTGRSVEVRAVFVLESDGSRITRSTHYIDIAGMMMQLGLAASNPSAA
jgi:steroid delta-isomerase-like uncharacterized protein